MCALREQLKALETRTHRLSWDFLPPLETDPSMGMWAEGPTPRSARPAEECLVSRVRSGHLARRGMLGTQTALSGRS